MEALRHVGQITSDDPDTQVQDTIALMGRYVREDWASPEIQGDLGQAVAPGQDPIHGIFWFVKQRLKFQQDSQIAIPLAPQYGLPIVEVLIRPKDMSVLCAQGECSKVGDCDDFAMYTAALLKAAGIKSTFVTIAADHQYPDRFSHVYLAAYPEGRGRIPMDVSHGMYPGWEATGLGRLEEWKIFAPIWPMLLGAVLVVWLIWGRQKGRGWV